MIQDNFQFILILGVIAFIFPFVGVSVAWLLRPKKSNKLKTTTYECGVETVGDTWSQFKAQYYLFALIFVIFDVEAVFLFPWAVVYNQLELYALVEALIFVAILFAGLIYAWRTNALQWQ